MNVGRCVVAWPDVSSCHRLPVLLPFSLNVGDPVVASYQPFGCNSHWVVHYGFADSDPSADCVHLSLTMSSYALPAPTQLLSAYVGSPVLPGNKMTFTLQQSDPTSVGKVLALQRMNFRAAPWTDEFVASSAPSSDCSRMTARVCMCMCMYMCVCVWTAWLSKQSMGRCRWPTNGRRSSRWSGRAK